MKKVFTLFNKNELLGYGPFNYYKLIGNIPHNIIIELILSFHLYRVFYHNDLHFATSL